VVGVERAHHRSPTNTTPNSTKPESDQAPGCTDWRRRFIDEDCRWTRFIWVTNGTYPNPYVADGKGMKRLSVPALRWMLGLDLLKRLVVVTHVGARMRPAWQRW
jgi:hypothetical protein